jgi:hypothetical protein
MPSRAPGPSGGDQHRDRSGKRLGSAGARSCVFLFRPRCATLDVIFVEHALDDRVGRSPEPALGLRFDSAQGAAQRWRTANLDPINANGDNCARADVGAAPQPAAAAEFRPDLNSECCMGFACQAVPIAAAVASRSWLTADRSQ